MYLGLKQFTFGEMVIAYVAGMLFGGLLTLLVWAVPAEAGITMNYANKVVQIVLDPDADGVYRTEAPSCPKGWKWEVYARLPDPENTPAFVPVLLEKGNCDARTD